MFILFFILGCVPTKPLYEGVVIDLRERKEMHFISVVLNGKRTLLLVDTGASKCLLDISQAKKFNFEYSLLSRNQYVGLGGLQDIYVVYNYELKDFYIPFLGADLSEVTRYFTRDTIHIVGILGSDFLERNNATLDFKRNKLFYNPE